MIPPGINYNTNAREYHAWRADRENLAASPVSCSLIKRFAPSPWHFWENWQDDITRTDAIIFGSLVDCLLTSPDEFDENFAVLPDNPPRRPSSIQRGAAKPSDSTLDSIAFWDAWEIRSAGRDIIATDTLALAGKRVRQILKHQEAGSVIDGADFQVAVVADVEGVPFKALVDIVPGEGRWGNYLFDLKTTAVALDDESLAREIAKRKYHWQAAFYLWLWAKVPGADKRTGFGWIFSNSTTGEVRVVEADQGLMLDPGNDAVLAYTVDYLRRVKTGDWSSRYATGVSRLQLPPYASMAEEAEVEALQSDE